MTDTYAVPSYDELPKGERVIFRGGEDYILEVLESSMAPKLKYKATPDEKDAFEDTITLKFGVISFADGYPPEDENGEAVEEVKWLWFDINPKHLGFTRDGTASLGRQALLGLNGIADVNERVPEGSIASLVGKRVIGSLVVANGLKGKKNKIKGFKPVNARRTRGAAAPDAAVTAAPVEAPADDWKDAATRVLGGGEPSAEDLATVQGYFES